MPRAASSSPRASCASASSASAARLPGAAAAQARERVRPGVGVRAGRPGFHLGQRPQAARVGRVRRQRLVEQRPRLPEGARLDPQRGQRQREFGVIRRPFPRLEEVLLSSPVVRRLEGRQPEPRVSRRLGRRHLDEAPVLDPRVLEAVLLQRRVARAPRREDVRQRRLGNRWPRLPTRDEQREGANASRGDDTARSRDARTATPIPPPRLVAPAAPLGFRQRSPPSLPMAGPTANPNELGTRSTASGCVTSMRSAALY